MTDLAMDLLVAKRCSPGCLLAMGTTPDQCTCHCGGRYHAALIWTEIPVLEVSR